ncbi:MAG: stage II sporulation protein M [Thermoguttaceae bacterium]
MNLDGWLQQRRPAWDRLGAIVDQLYRRGPRHTAPRDVEEMTQLYQTACADLARLRACNFDPDLVASLNRLVTRAHGQIYRGPSRRPWRLSHFFLVQYPLLFRQTWTFTAASLAISVSAALMAFVTVQHKPEIVCDVMGCCFDREFYGPKTVADIRDRFKAIDSPLMSSFVITNNVRVALTAFALGITFGLGTVYMLTFNGVMVGGIAGAFAKSGIGWQFWMVILPHGALELSAIVVAGGAGLLLGHSLWCPGQRTRRRALREEAIRAVQLAAGLIPAFAVAGFFEGFVTPSDAIPEALKVGLGIATAAIFWLYLLLGGRRAEGRLRFSSIKH